MACNYYDIYVDQLDLDDATGNTMFFDNTLYVSYDDCNNDPESQVYYITGSYDDSICVFDSGLVQVFYYKNDNIVTSVYSSANIAGTCSSGVTPTPTPTYIPPTPTPTPTTQGTCWTIEIANGDSPIFCDETDNGSDELYIKYTDNNGVFHNVRWDQLQYDIGTPGYNTYYLCLQNSTTPNYAYGPSGINEVLSCSLQESYGSCFDDAACELSPTPTPTNTPTSTRTSVWYVLENCNDSATAYSVEYLPGTFTNRERVTSNGGLFTFIIIGELSSNPGGILQTLTGTGLTECPETPTPTPTQTQTPTTTTTLTATPTRTTTPTQTPTATRFEIITGNTDCNIVYNGGSGGRGYFEITVQLGSGTGTINFDFNAYTVPDQFQVFWNGSKVIDTGFRGDSSYNSQLNALGYPNVSGPGSGSASFNKTLASPTTALVVVTAPIVGTAWEFLMGCPPIAPTPSNTGTPTNTPTPTQTRTPTQTQTPTGLSCQCYQAINTTNTDLNITYTPCGDPESTVTIPANGVLNFCVQDGTTIFRDEGISNPTLCGISCLFDGVDCSTCAEVTPTPTTTTTLTATPTQTPTTTTTLTATPTQTPTQTRTQTPTTTTTLTATPTQTPTQTITPTITSSPTTTPTQTPSHTPTNFPIEYSPNGFSYDFMLNKLFISTSETKRVSFDGIKTAINFLGETNEILTVNITENGFKLIGLSEGSGQYVLVSDSNGVMYYAEAPGGNVEQTSFVSITGGTVIDNVWYFIGDNNSGSIEIVEIYGSDANINEDRTVALGPYSLIYSGSNANQFKLVNTNEGVSNTIESGSGDTVNFNVDVSGNLFANSKSFLVKNIDKEGYNLRHGSLEGPENGVYFRGKTTASYIMTPLEWEWLVDYDTVTVILTSNCGDDIYVKEINSTMITIGGNTCEYSYVVYGERKDIDRMNIEIRE